MSSGLLSFTGTPRTTLPFSPLCSQWFSPVSYPTPHSNLGSSFSLICPMGTSLSQLSSKICPLFLQPHSWAQSWIMSLLRITWMGIAISQLASLTVPSRRPILCVVAGIYFESQGKQNKKQTYRDHSACGTVVESTDFWIKRPGFEPQLYRFLTVNLSCLAGNTRTKSNLYFRGMSWQFSEWICKELCLVQS